LCSFNISIYIFGRDLSLPKGISSFWFPLERDKIMSNKLKLITVLFLFGIFLFNGSFVCTAACTYTGVDTTGLKTTAGCVDGVNTESTEENKLPIIIGNFIGVFLSFLGVIFFVLMIYGGTMWMTAGGKSEQIEKARKVIIHAILGVIIVLMAYAITTAITSRIAESIEAE
jgi:hypothetical protein